MFFMKMRLKRRITMPLLVIIAVVVVIIVVTKSINEKKYKELDAEVLRKLGFSSWNIVSDIDANVIVKSRQALEKYDDIKFFKENKEKLVQAKKIIQRKNEVANILSHFLSNNEYKGHSQYNKLAENINTTIRNAKAYRICVTYISSAGNNLGTRIIRLSQYDIDKFDEDPALLMGKGELNKYLKEQEKEALNQKQHKYYENVNKIIDYANENRKLLFIKGSVEQLDNLIMQLFDRTVNSIKKIKDINSEEWEIINKFVAHIEQEITKIVDSNQRILDYYDSPAFFKIKETCEVLMSTQREFNEYITEKVESISQLFGTRVVRNETINEDEYQYIRPYKKTINPFMAEVSATVFASAENNPLDYVIKNFYPNKNIYPEQIQKLHLLIEELATLKEAKEIIENYKKEYQQYINDVPDYVMEEDEAGFYSRLGFANIDESVLVVEYTFSYTSSGGKAKRKFTVPMTEESIVELIKALEEKFTASDFTKEQRALMTNKLREFVKKRDDFTCRICGNSIHAEPNLLLEIDHIVPVSKGGCTIEDNLQTLCWKCNRAKSNKMAN
ncbi:MAG: HNH endonuclease [Ruminococcaceae bacterium]|nr:HNH endonuclease [Oscillospiraceae bacterium]